jgi:hypothetical protein
MSETMFVFGMLGFVIVAAIIFRTNDNIYIRYGDNDRSINLSVFEKVKGSFRDELGERCEADKSEP